MQRRTLLIAGFSLFALSPFAAVSSSKAKSISAPQAKAGVESGELVLIDIRSREEWKETGIAEMAIPMSMHEAGFLEKFTDLKSENPDKTIAMICATGGRTKWLQAELKKRKLGDTIDVSEGMMGNGKALGWIKRGLPIKTFK